MRITDAPVIEGYDAVIVAVAHNEFIQEHSAVAYSRPRSVVVDVKGILPRTAEALRL